MLEFNRARKCTLTVCQEERENQIYVNWITTKLPGKGGWSLKIQEKAGKKKVISYIEGKKVARPNAFLTITMSKSNSGIS